MKTIFQTEDGVIVFPDLGATTRYKYLTGKPQTFFHKMRNQINGEIESLLLSCNGEMVKNVNLYIVDDICDGGATFIKSCEKLKEYNPKSINLVVSHGLFTKGTKILYDAGITKIFTTNSLLRNNKRFNKQNFEVYNIFDNYIELPYNDGYEKRVV
jgi:ribose-phosphate pyrophosphokinase